MCCAHDAAINEKNFCLKSYQDVETKSSKVRAQSQGFSDHAPMKSVAALVPTVNNISPTVKQILPLLP